VVSLPPAPVLLFVVADDAVSLRLIGAIVQQADLGHRPDRCPRRDLAGQWRSLFFLHAVEPLARTAYSPPHSILALFVAHPPVPSHGQR
jgi:hypothetical protein